MSRIGKQIVAIPEKTEVIFNDGVLKVKGPHGELERTFRPLITITVEDGTVKFASTKDTKFANSLWGTYASHVKNMIKGVNEPYIKKLVVEGVGFRSQVSGDKLVLNLGFSHPVEMQIPAGLTVTAEKNLITITGIDKESVGSFAAEVRATKKPEPYKGKGIHYEDEIVRRKEGKKTA